MFYQRVSKSGPLSTCYKWKFNKLKVTRKLNEVTLIEEVNHLRSNGMKLVLNVRFQTPNVLNAACFSK
jgi:hypothetical protein